MTDKKIIISPFHPSYQKDIDNMMAKIAGEFAEAIFSPTSKKIVDIADFPNNRFWVALHENKAMGTIGLSTLSHHSIVLKSMFLARNLQGFGVGKLLLNTLEGWCRDNKYTNIYLGTMAQFKSGQKFYERNQFQLISETDLPSDFLKNPLDTIHYQKTIAPSPKIKTFTHS